MAEVPLQGDAGASLGFLKWVRPAGPWVLTAIPPDGERTYTRTFEADQEADLEAWVAGRVATDNLYWTVNGLKGPTNSKPKKEDVQQLEWLHVDIDPPKEVLTDPEGLRAARAAILARLEAFSPAPSLIVDSGGGYQGFWRLDEPLWVGGDPIRINDAEAYNQQLELLLGGDHCWNIDRIMRLPGSINWLNRKKISVGRIPAPAHAVHRDDAAVYPLHAFTPAPQVQSASAATHTELTPGVRLSGNLPPVRIEDLPDRVTNRTRTLIVGGDDPDDQTRFSSRSEVVWAVTCDLIRAGLEDDTIAAILLDPEYGVSAHIRAQRRPVESAARTIQRAREEVEEPLLRIFNERHAVIADMGGRCRIISEVLDISLDPPRTRMSKQSFEDFRNRYMHQQVQVGVTKNGQAVYKAAGAWWLTHPMRRQFDTMVFAPGRETPHAYNLWRGYACEAVPGNQHHSFLAHVRDNICSGNADYYNYLLHWMARAVQHPGTPGEVAVVLRGGMGTGKGTFAHQFGAIFGRHYLQVTSTKHLVGQFNHHLRDCVVLFADEAFFAGDKQHESVLKSMVTEPTLVIEPKGVDAEVQPNYIHLILAGNGDWLVPAGKDERRYFVLDVSEDKKQNHGYFAAIRDAMEKGGRESLLHHLMNLDLTGFEVRRVPQTDTLREQKLRTMSLEEQWWMERLMDGRITATANGWSEEVTKDNLQADYLRYAEAQRTARRVSPIVLSKFLERVLPEDYPRGTQKVVAVARVDDRGGEYMSSERTYVYEMPPLAAARAVWDAKYGGPYPWPKDVEQKALPAPY